MAVRRHVFFFIPRPVFPSPGWTAWSWARGCSLADNVRNFWSDDLVVLGILFWPWLCWEKRFQGKRRPWQTYSETCCLYLFWMVNYCSARFWVWGWNRRLLFRSTDDCRLCRIIAISTELDRLSLQTPKFSFFDNPQLLEISHESLDTGFSSFNSPNVGWLKGKQKQMWWQSHTHTKQNTHVHTEKEGQSSKRAISQSINQRINQTLKRQTDKPTDKQTDRQTNKKTTKETKEQTKKETNNQNHRQAERQLNKQNYRGTHQLSHVQRTWGTGWEGCHTPTFTWPLQV